MKVVKKLQKPLRTISGAVLPKGEQVNVIQKKKSYYVESKGLIHPVYEDDLLEALLPPHSEQEIAAFVKEYAEGKTFNFSRYRLEFVARSVVRGNYINAGNKQKAIAALDAYIGKDSKAATQITAARASNMNCPKCGGAMTRVKLADDIPAWNCLTDKITLPCV